MFIQVPNLRRVIRHGVRLAIQQFDSIPGYLFHHNKPIYQLTIDGQNNPFTWQRIRKMPQISESYKHVKAKLSNGSSQQGTI
jgi:hypothetical protein